MREITLVMAHFANLQMLAEQQKVWAAYPADLRARLHVRVTDDCSPKAGRPSHKSITVNGLASFEIYRCLPVPKDLRADGKGKVRWNWLFARNLGVAQTPTDWVLLTDMDHVLPLETLRRLLDGPLDTARAYRFARVDAPHPWPYRLQDCRPYKPHNDTWLMTKALFNYDDGKRFVCGYDETLSGCYGSSGEFRDRVAAVAAVVNMVNADEVVIRYPREVIADASTPLGFYTRKNDAKNDAELQMRKERRDRKTNWRPRRLTFPYELVASRALRQEVA